MSDRDEFYRRFSKSYDKLHQSEMQDDLVERVALAIECADVRDVGYHDLARAAIALALEEAAKVADEFESDADPDAGAALAAAIRALIPPDK